MAVRARTHTSLGKSSAPEVVCGSHSVDVFSRLLVRAFDFSHFLFSCAKQTALVARRTAARGRSKPLPVTSDVCGSGVVVAQRRHCRQKCVSPLERKRARNGCYLCANGSAARTTSGAQNCHLASRSEHKSLPLPLTGTAARAIKTKHFGAAASGLSFAPATAEVRASKIAN